MAAAITGITGVLWGGLALLSAELGQAPLAALFAVLAALCGLVALGR